MHATLPPAPWHQAGSGKETCCYPGGGEHAKSTASHKKAEDALGHPAQEATPKLRAFAAAPPRDRKDEISRAEPQDGHPSNTLTVSHPQNPKP